MRPRKNKTAAAGKSAEEEALAFLQQQGLRFLTKNYRCKQGEIDLIFNDGPTLVFVEVRYRNNPRFGGALASVDFRKQQRLIRCAEYYLLQHRTDQPVRFDVIALDAGCDIQWIKDAFQVTL